MEKLNYRVSFSPNFLEPFTWKCKSFESACLLTDWLVDFDFRRKPNNSDSYPIVGRMIAAYKVYLCQHGINRSNLIHTSTCTIDKFEDGEWRIDVRI